MRILTAILLTLCGCHMVEPISNGIPNLAAVEPGIWRGGQPSEAGWRWLKAQGVTDVVKLNTEAEGSDAYAEMIGLKVWRFPVTTEMQVFGGDRLRAAIEEAEVPIGTNCFVHCEWGANRTGTVIGYWRVLRCGWTKQKAQVEMNALGWGNSLPGLKHFWAEVKEQQDTPWNHHCTKPGNDSSLVNIGCDEIRWWCGCGKSGTNKVNQPKGTKP